MMEGKRLIPELLASLPQFTETALPWPHRVDPRDASCVVVLDDDPTGTQTVHDIEVVTDWEVDTLCGAFSRAERGFFILTNTRALTEAEAIRTTRQIATNLQLALPGLQAGGAPAPAGTPCRWKSFALVSRGDSTLRGHFPAETDALADVCGAFDATVLVPFFEAGGRITVGNTHYLRDGDSYVPVAESVYARDPAFGYTHSNLPEWVQEKTRNRIRAEEVVSISLDLLRGAGALEALKAAALSWTGNRIVVINAASARDVDIAVRGLMEAERAGKRFLYRTAASFAAARLGIDPLPPLSRDALQARLPVSGNGGLVIVGSFVKTTTQQLERLLASGRCSPVEVSVTRLLAVERDDEITRVIAALEHEIGAGRHALAYTSRDLVTGGGGNASLAIGKRVSDALVEIVRGLAVAPRWVLAKGGITSSDIATAGLGVKVARVVGQILPGIPIWEIGAETRWPRSLYIVFPGNVGGPNALVEALEKLV
jgi:uncharacterized protein YgbK (DUF1537 family)